MIIHANREDLAGALAAAVARALSRVISLKDHATLAVSGGTTPQRFFERLSGCDISWDKVTVTLVDERQVEETSPRSNARLVKSALLRGKAQPARFVPLYRNIKTAQRLALDVVVLGMGSDGHTASFFPGGDQLALALASSTTDAVIEMNALAAGEPRLTFTLASLLAANALFLHIEGAEKSAVLEEARAGTDVMIMPIRAIFQSGHALQIHWCP